MPLVSLSSPKSNTPKVLPEPAQAGVTGCDPVSLDRRFATAPTSEMEVT
jgi:hypothetical protein